MLRTADKCLDVGGNPLRYIDVNGRTASDVNAAINAIGETFPQLDTDVIWIWWDFDWGGIIDSPTEAVTGLFPPIIRLETEYQGCLNWGEAYRLLQIMMHELLHYNDTVSDRFSDWRNPNHAAHYNEANRMAQQALDAFYRNRNNNPDCECSKSAQ